MGVPPRAPSPAATNGLPAHRAFAGAWTQPGHFPVSSRLRLPGCSLHPGPGLPRPAASRPRVVGGRCHQILSPEALQSCECGEGRGLSPRARCSPPSCCAHGSLGEVLWVKVGLPCPPVVRRPGWGMVLPCPGYVLWHLVPFAGRRGPAVPPSPGLSSSPINLRVLVCRLHHSHLCSPVFPHFPVMFRLLPSGPVGFPQHEV